jgi:hypothetical protein
MLAVLAGLKKTHVKKMKKLRKGIYKSEKECYNNNGREGYALSMSV